MDNLSDIESLVMGIKEIIPSKFEEIKNRSLNVLCKPSGGLWGCPVNSEGQYLSDWIKFCALSAPDWFKDFIFSDEDGLRYRYLFSLWDVNSILLFNLDCVKEQTYYELDTNKILIRY